MSSTRTGNSSSASGSRSRTGSRTDSVCVRQLGRWLASGFTGCGFAQSFAAKAGSSIALSPFDPDAGPDKIDGLFDFAAARNCPVIAVFPAIQSEVQLVEQLQLLGTGSRWQISREQVKGLETEDVLVGIRWTTLAGLTSLPMGFGPFATMPVTRRAPYVCLATWPGGHENPHRIRPNPKAVDFLDSRLPKPLSPDEYRRVWTGSEQRTTELLSELGDRSSYYRKVAFRLSAAVAGRF